MPGTRPIWAIVKARSWLDDLTAGRKDSIDAIATGEGESSRNIRMMIQLAFLDPEIVEAVVDGRLPDGLGATEIVRDDRSRSPDGLHEQRRVPGV